MPGAPARPVTSYGAGRVAGLREPAPEDISARRGGSVFGGRCGVCACGEDEREQEGEDEQAHGTFESGESELQGMSVVGNEEGGWCRGGLKQEYEGREQRDGDARASTLSTHGILVAPGIFKRVRGSKHEARRDGHRSGWRVVSQLALEDGG
jgi:hypothetical protein